MTASALTDSLRETLACFDAGVPQTTSEVADRLDLGRRSTYDRLERLVEHDRLETKKVGASARVWWKPPAAADRATANGGRPAAAGPLIDDVIDDAEIGLFVLDSDFEVVWINETAERYFDLDRDRALGRDKRSLVTDHLSAVVDDGSSFADTVLATYENNTYAEQFECRVTAGEDREARRLEHRSKPIETGDYAGGRLELYYDVSDQKRSEHARRTERTKFESVVEAVEEYAIFMLDAHGRIQSWNTGAEQIKGHDADDIIGEHVSTFYTEADRASGVPEANLAAAAEAGSVEDEGWRVRADGSRFWATVSITALRDDDGELQGYMKVTQDMTDSREREQAVYSERALLERVLEVSPTGIAIFDTNGEVRRVNQRFSTCLGLAGTAPEMYVLGDLPLLDENGDVIPFHERPAQRALTTGESVVDEHVQIRGYDGQMRWLSVNAEPLGDDAGIVTTVDDITRLKEQTRHLERQHEELEAELESVFERIDDAFYALDDELRFTYVNDRAETLLGYSESELLGRNIWQALSVSADDPLRDPYETALATQTATSFERYSEPLDIWVSVRVFPSESGLSVYFTDITEQKERERDLEESERRYRTLVENFPDGMVALFDDDLEYTLVGGHLLEQHGFDPDTLVGERAGTLTQESIASGRIEPAYRRALAGETTTLQIPLADRELRIQVAPVTDDDGAVFSGMMIAQDITERKRKERRLREREASLKRTTELLEQSQQLANVGAWELDVSTTPADLRWTDEVYRIHDLSPDQEIDLEQSVSFYHPEDRPRIREAVEHAIEDGEPYDLTLRVEPANGGLRWVRGICAPVQTDGNVVALRGAFQDITERTKREQELERQREQLAALNNINDVVHSITDQVIGQSTREEIERVVCERLAETESYLFAWIGDVDVSSQTVNLRTEAGVEGYLDEITISADPDDERSKGPTGRALLEREIQTAQDIETDSRHDPWRDHLEKYDFRSSAAIPIVHEDTVYGVLNVYADRPNAFEDKERAVISQLGEVIGHAIAAAERKRALMSDDVVELQFRIRDIFAAVSADVTASGTIAIDHIVPIESNEYLAYGTVTEDAIAGMDALVETLPHWADITYRATNGLTSFELRLSDPPVLSTVASLGGAIEQVTIEDSDYKMTVHLAPGAEVRQAIDAVQTTYPSAELLKHKQTTRTDTTAERVRHVLTDDLTDRQRAALEAAYHAGFFEWPRDASGEDIADSLEIAPATFHQHLRRAQKEVFESLLSGPTSH